MLRGGQGNYKLLSFDHTKDMVFKAEMQLVDYKVLAMLTNKAMLTESVNIPKREVLVASSTHTITLSATPAAATPVLKIYALSNRDVGTEQVLGNPATPAKYSISGAVVQLNATSGVEGATFAASYTYASPATNKTVTFTADKFAGYVRCIGTGVVNDQVTGALVATVFDIKKMKAKNNFSLTMKSTEATKLTMDFDCYPVDIVETDGTISKVYMTMTALT